MPLCGISRAMAITRLCMILSSLTPLFILWAIRGIEAIHDHTLWIICSGLVVIPNLVLWLKIRQATDGNKKSRKILVSSSRDQREHLLVYLFATLMPLYDANISQLREVASVIGALAFVVFLFWHLNLHYMNIIFALFGYRVFTVQANTTDTISENAETSENRLQTMVIFSKKDDLKGGKWLTLHRVDDYVWIEKEDI